MTRYSRIARFLLDRYLARQYAARLAGPRYEPLPALDPKLPVLLVANHFSWWDGFLLFDLQRRLRPRAEIYTIMLERELRKARGLRYIGAVGIEPEKPASVRSAFAFLRDRRRSLGADCLVSFFPQGRIWPTTRRPLGFRPGVELLSRLLAPVQVLPVAMHIEPLNTARPHAFVTFGEPLRVNEGESADAVELERRVAAALDRTLARLHAEGEDVLRAAGVSGRVGAPEAEE